MSLPSHWFSQIPVERKRQVPPSQPLATTATKDVTRRSSSCDCNGQIKISGFFLFFFWNKAKSLKTITIRQHRTMKTTENDCILLVTSQFQMELYPKKWLHVKQLKQKTFNYKIDGKTRRESHFQAGCTLTAIFYGYIW